MNILFIVNIHSGRKNNKIGILDALDVFSGAGHSVSVYVTQAKLDAYQYVLDHASFYDLVCVSGGDGTLNEVTSGLIQLEHKPCIGYFPSGTMNDFGSNFQLGSDMRQIANRIVSGGRDVFDIGKINDRYFNYVAGFGAFCEVSYETNQELKSRIGNLAYILKAISTFPSLHPYHVKLNIDGQLVEKDLLFGLIINGIRVAGQDIVEHRSDAMKDGLFEVILVEHTSNVLEMVNYPMGMLNPSWDMKHVNRYRAKHIEILSNEPLPWTLDGEAFGPCREVVIENLPSVLAIAC